MLTRHIGQKFALATAAFCGFMALPALGLFFWTWQNLGFDNTWTPSALTTVVFFLTCSVVLYVMSRPLPALPSTSTNSSED
jgi:hypothetical protein